MVKKLQRIFQLGHYIHVFIKTWLLILCQYRHIILLLLTRINTLCWRGGDVPESQCSDKLNINLRAVKKQSHPQWVFLHIFKAIPLPKVFFYYFIVINKSWKNLPKNQSKRDYEKKELSSAAKDQSASAAPDIFDKFLVHLLHFINSANKHKASLTLSLHLCPPASP